jgi:hypothetical protein
MGTGERGQSRSQINARRAEERASREYTLRLEGGACSHLNSSDSEHRNRRLPGLPSVFVAFVAWPSAFRRCGDMRRWIWPKIASRFGILSTSDCAMLIMGAA